MQASKQLTLFHWFPQSARTGSAVVDRPAHGAACAPLPVQTCAAAARYGRKVPAPLHSVDRWLLCRTCEVKYKSSAGEESCCVCRGASRLFRIVQDGHAVNYCSVSPSAQLAHISYPFHSRLRAPCGRRGKPGSASPSNAPFSISPVFHNPDLENLPTPQPAPTKPLRLNSHFSEPNYGYYYLFNSSKDRFNTPPSHALCAAATVYPRDSLAGSCCRKASIPVKHQHNSENQPSFPRARNPFDGYNQREQKTAISVPPQCVVECGRSGKVALGTNRTYANRGN